MIKKIIRQLHNKLHKSPKEEDQDQFLRKIMNYAAASDLDGDYLEFGVFQGGNFASAYQWAQKKKLHKMRFYAFDSFEGLPKSKGLDAEYEQFAEGECEASQATFNKNLEKTKVDLDKVTVIPGWFKNTLTKETKEKLPIKSAAVIWVDCDLYESTVPVLEFITDYIVDGTLLIFDDWFHFRGHPDKGEQLAFSEWLKKNPQFIATEFHKYYWHGNSFIINKKD